MARVSNIPWRVVNDDCLFFRVRISNPRKVSLDPRRLIAQDGQCQAVVITGLSGTDLGLSLLQLRLAQFNDRTQSELVPRLRKIKREVRLVQQLLRDRDSLIDGIRVEPTGAHVA